MWEPSTAGHQVGKLPTRMAMLLELVLPGGDLGTLPGSTAPLK